jgi:hypothetical protein
MPSDLDRCNSSCGRREYIWVIRVWIEEGGIEIGMGDWAGGRNWSVDAVWQGMRVRVMLMWVEGLIGMVGV